MEQVFKGGGKDLIGKKVEVWNNGKYGPFKAIGSIIDYHSTKSKKQKRKYLIRFPGTINQGNHFEMWFPLSRLTILDSNI